MFKKKLMILTTIIAFLLCFPFHFVYDKFPNFITSIFFPINESIWEHMKLLFNSIIVSGIIEKFILSKQKEDTTNICFSNFIGAIISIPLFLVLFLPIYNSIGENFKITILIMLITIIISKFIVYKLSNNNDFNMENKVKILIVITYILFGILTYNPLNNYIFTESKQCIYQIN